MTTTDQIRILNRKIRQNEAQCDLDRKAAKISALSSNNLDKYEYLSGEDLNLKPSTVEQAKFEYSSLGKIFNKGLKEEDKKKGILKRLENIKDKNEELLNTFSTTNKVNNASKNKINNQSKNLIYSTQYSFAKFKNMGDIKELSINAMHKKLKNFHKKLTSLKNVAPWIKPNKNLNNKVLNDAGDLYNDLCYIYKDKYNEGINNLDMENRKKFGYKKLRLTADYLYPSEEDEQQTSKNFNKKEPPEKPTKTDLDELNGQIIKEETEINEELFKNYFNFQKPTEILKNLFNLNDENKNEQLVDVIKSGLIDLKNESKKMSEDEIKTEEPYKIVETVEKILKLNQQKQQQGLGLKILTPNQMLSRLPIILAQLNAGNNSEKLKNEIRQLLYSLYGSKKLTKQIYKSLIDII